MSVWGKEVQTVSMQRKNQSISLTLKGETGSTSSGSQCHGFGRQHNSNNKLLSGLIQYTIPMLPGVTDPKPCFAVVRVGRMRTQSPTLNSSTLSISAGSAFHPLDAPGNPTRRIPSSSTHSTVPILSRDCPRQPNLIMTKSASVIIMCC